MQGRCADLHGGDGLVGLALAKNAVANRERDRREYENDHDRDREFDQGKAPVGCRIGFQFWFHDPMSESGPVPPDTPSAP